MNKGQLHDRTWNELEIYCEKMGWEVEETNQARVEGVASKRYKEGRWESIINNPSIYKQCQVCHYKFVVNNWDDRKSRTPRLAGLIVCAKCDPRHVDDRHLKTGYRILHPDRLFIFKQALLTQNVAAGKCLNKPKKGKKPKGCKCVRCQARKLLK